MARDDLRKPYFDQKYGELDYTPKPMNPCPPAEQGPAVNAVPKPTRLHPSTYEYLRPSDEQMELMSRLRQAARTFSEVLENLLPEGPDKTFILRAHRANAMWANVAITRRADGTPRP